MLQATGIKSDEAGLAIRVSAIFLVSQMSHAFSANAADALFFTRFGVENLPIMIAIAGLVTMVVLLIHSGGLATFGAPRWLPLVAAGAAVLAIAEWLLTFGAWRPVYAVIWVTTQAVIWLTFTSMWNAAGATADTRQAKRLFPIYASAGVGGAILGNLLTGPIASWAGTESLLLIQALLLVVTVVLMTNAARSFDGTDPSGERSSGGTLRGAARMVISVPLIRLVAMASVTLWALFYMVVFPFSEVVSNSFDTDAAIAGFLGLFSSAATGATFVVSLFVTKWLFSRLGIVNSLLLVPVIYGIGFITWLVAFGLPLAATVRGAQWVMVSAVGGTAMMSLFNVLPGRQRGQVSAFVTAVPAQVGIVLGGLVLMVGPAMGNDLLFIMGLVVSALTALLVWLMRPAYVNALVAAVRDGLIGVFRAPSEHVTSSLGREALELLSRRLSSDSADDRLVAVAALNATGADVVSLVEPLLNDPDPGVRTAALQSMSSRPEVIELHRERLILDDWPPVRRGVLGASSVLGPHVQTAVAGRLVDDPDPSVRAEAAWVLGGERGQATIDQLLESQHPESILAVLQGLRPGRGITVDPSAYVEHPVSVVRSAAVSHVSHDPDGLGILGRTLGDPAMAVRNAAAQRLAEVPTGRLILIETLHSGSVSETDVALRALSPGDLIDQDVLAWAHNETDRAAYLDRRRKEVESGPQSPSVEYLAAVLRIRSRRISDWVILSMRTPSTTREIDLIERGIWSDDTTTRAQAYEALDAIANRSVTTPLLALLETGSSTGDDGRDEALQSLANDFDPWIKDLAIKSLLELADSDQIGVSGTVMADLPMMLSHDEGLLDKMIALHKVEMFAGLDPEDLEHIAAAANETSFATGEPIYTEGAAADEMLVIVSGEVVVSTRHDGAERRVAVYGPGQHVGELALLRKATRSADVYAGDRGLAGLRIKESDFRSVLEERPRVAMAMMETLANRLAEQT